MMIFSINIVTNRLCELTSHATRTLVATAVFFMEQYCYHHIYRFCYCSDLVTEWMELCRMSVSTMRSQESMLLLHHLLVPRVPTTTAVKGETCALFCHIVLWFDLYNWFSRVILKAHHVLGYEPCCSGLGLHCYYTLSLYTEFQKGALPHFGHISVKLHRFSKFVPQWELDWRQNTSLFATTSVLLPHYFTKPENSNLHKLP